MTRNEEKNRLTITGDDYARRGENGQTGWQSKPQKQLTVGSIFVPTLEEWLDKFTGECNTYGTRCACGMSLRRK